MNSAVFISVRSDSERLPEKCFMKIKGRMVLEHVIDRAKQIGVQVIVCTTDRSCDDRIETIALAEKVKVFRGSLTDKLVRWLGACDKYGIDSFVTMDADDLFCDIELCKQGLNLCNSFNYDFIKSPEGLITGLFTYAMRTHLLRSVVNNKTTDKTEQIDSFFGVKESYLGLVHKSLFNDQIRLTLDYQEDFDMFEKVFSLLCIKENIIPSYLIVEILTEYPKIVAINSHRNKDWKERRIEQSAV